jgi:hypothetical protein
MRKALPIADTALRLSSKFISSWKAIMMANDFSRLGVAMRDDS